VIERRPRRYRIVEWPTTSETGLAVVTTEAENIPPTLPDDDLLILYASDMERPDLERLARRLREEGHTVVADWEGEA
jgi:hypothetical protein